jgi:hypothetical protein
VLGFRQKSCTTGVLFFWIHPLLGLKPSMHTTQYHVLLGVNSLMCGSTIVCRNAEGGSVRLQ